MLKKIWWWLRRKDGEELIGLFLFLTIFGCISAFTLPGYLILYFWPKLVEWPHNICLISFFAVCWAIFIALGHHWREGIWFFE